MSLPSAARRGLAALELLSTLSDGDLISAADREVLGGWTGWGPLAPALGADVPDAWIPVADRLDEVLSEAQLTAARELCDTSFFTPKLVSDAAFALLRQSGFDGGRVLEPGCGSGAIMGAAPTEWEIAWTGIDADPTATRIAALMHPDANIVHSRLEKHHFVEDSFDAVIGNVPFSKSGVFDPNITTRLSLHGYFTHRALEAVKPGGVLVIITSRHYLDSVDTLYDTPFGDSRFELLSAVRLPAGVFDGTQVVADILVLRKPVSDEIRATVFPTEIVERARRGTYSWQSYVERVRVHRRVNVEHDDPAQNVLVSGLWADHPELVAGTMQATGFQPAPLTVKASDPTAAVRAATAAACTRYEPETVARAGALDLNLADVPVEDAAGRKEGSFHVIDGAMHQVADGALTPVNRPSKELAALVELRDAILNLLELESDADLPDEAIAETRTRALHAYQSYAEKFGPVGRGTLIEGKVDPETGAPTYSWRRPPLGGFRKDPDYFTVLGAEVFDQGTGEASPAPILLHRVNRAASLIEHTENAGEAARLASNVHGVVDLSAAARLLGKDEDEASKELDPHVFLDPELGSLVLAATYLSGNVRHKRAAAQQAGLTQSIEALEAVMPAEATELEIRAQLGATWIPAQFVEQFMQDELGCNGSVRHVPGVSVWEVESNYSSNLAKSATYGTPDISASKLLELALNNGTPTIYDEVMEHGTTRRVKNAAKTIAAEEKQSALNARFETWVWEDTARADHLRTEFNRRFRSHVTRTGDGAHLTFPGLSEDISLWEHQKDAIDRIITSERIILDHSVGAGKSFEAIVGAMKLKQLGLVQKPLIAVPNHLIEQFAREARMAYPTGRFLIAGREEVSKDQKRLFAARCATGDWDAIIMTHTAMGSIPVSSELEAQWIGEKKAELATILAAQGAGDSKLSRRGQKRVAAAMRKLESQLEAVRHDSRRDENQITFEHLGVDHISVDELHLYRRLMVTASSQSGFSLGHSKRSADLFLKIRSLAERRPGAPVFAGFTGTLISNTLAEIFVWQTFVQPDRLAEAGVATFDEWASTFVEFVTAVEVKPTGQGFHMKRRPRRIRNARELAMMLSQNCDTVTAEQIGLERPEFTLHNVVSDPTPEQQEVVQSLSERADDIYAGTVTPDKDNMLSVCNEGRALALDPQLIGVAGGSPSVFDAAERIAKLYHQNAGRQFAGSSVPGMLQLVFCDLGTPKPGDPSTYGRLRNVLSKLGVPASRVRFVHEATTDKARAALFAQCRAGDVSVLIGSTPKVGVGTNIQTRLGAIHHLDAPWTPAEVEQREGRGLRPRNLCSHLDIFRYVTEGTFDALTWETLERKAKSIGHFKAAAASELDIEDITDTSLSYGQVKALATGQPELLRLAEVSNEVRRLQMLRTVWVRQVNGAETTIKQLEREKGSLKHRVDGLVTAQQYFNPQEQGRVETLAVAMKQLRLESPRGHGTHRTSQHTCRGFEVRGRFEPNGQYVELEVLVNGYQVAHTETVPRKTLRRTARVVAEHIDASLMLFGESIPERVDRARRHIDQSTREIEQLTEFISGARFDREEDLQQAMTEQLSIVRLLEQAAAAEPVAA